MGIIIKPSANPPASVEKCLNGSTTTLYAKIPITMEGTPFNRSATYRTTNPIVLPPNSARYTPPRNPMGTPTSDARRSSLALPTMAWAIPPPVSPTGVGSFVKKSQLSARPPWYTR